MVYSIMTNSHKRISKTGTRERWLLPKEVKRGKGGRRNLDVTQEVKEETCALRPRFVISREDQKKDSRGAT